MSLNPKWLEVLKGDDRLAVAIACGLFLLAAHFGWIPSLPLWTLQAAWFGLLLFGCLWSVTLIVPLFMLLELLWLWLRRLRSHRR
jgi:hypothetical protein